MALFALLIQRLKETPNKLTALRSDLTG